MTDEQTTSSAVAPVRIAVCVITCRRPEGLGRLLDGLDKLVFSGDAPALEVVVVDNDPAGSTRELCQGRASAMRWPVRWFEEARRGISFARNKAVTCAGDDVDFVAFIDDDEVPEPLWLDELLKIQRLHNADVVAGPVITHFLGDVPEWIVKGRFFDHPRYPTGHYVKVVGTGNVAVRREIFAKLGGLFDERLALTGGEDRHFFKRVYRAGYKLVWADEAIAWEWVPASRANTRWILQRFYRQGASNSFCELDLTTSVLTRPMLAVQGCGWVVGGLGLMPLGLVLGRHKWVRYLRYVCYGVGMVAGTVGLGFEEYRHTHGT